MFYCSLQRGVQRRVCAMVIAWAAACILQGHSVATAAGVSVEKLLTGLRQPTGIAVRPSAEPGNYELFVSEAGAGRVVRVASTKSSKPEEVIVGFVSSADSNEPKRLPGPHGLVFLDANRLVVMGSAGPGRSFVRLYDVADPKKRLTAEQYEQQAEVAADDTASHSAVDVFLAADRTRANDHVPDYLVLVGIGDNAGASVWRLPVRGGTLGDLMPFSKKSSASALAATAVSPGGYVVLARSAGSGGVESSRLTFINPIDGQVTLELDVKLSNVVALQYNSESGNLYALGRSGNGEGEGVYRIDADPTNASRRPSAAGKKVADVAGPTAMAFGPDGALYVTSASDGEVIKISGKL